MKLDVTFVAARILGPLFVITGVALILHNDRLADILAGFDDSPLMAFAGFLTLLAGLAIVVLHPHWRGISAALVSLIGWLFVVRGAITLLAPWAVLDMALYVQANPNIVPIVGCVMALIGVWLAYAGYIAGTLRVEEPPRPGL